MHGNADFQITQRYRQNRDDMTETPDTLKKRNTLHRNIFFGVLIAPIAIIVWWYIFQGEDLFGWKVPPAPAIFGGK